MLWRKLLGRRNCKRGRQPRVLTHVQEHLVQVPSLQAGDAGPEAIAIVAPRVRLDLAKLGLEELLVSDEAGAARLIEEREQVEEARQLAKALLEPRREGREALHPQPRVHKLVREHLRRVNRGQPRGHVDLVNFARAAGSGADSDRRALHRQMPYADGERRPAKAEAMPRKNAADIGHEERRVRVVPHELVGLQRMWRQAEMVEPERSLHGRAETFSPPPGEDHDAKQASGQELPEGQTEASRFRRPPPLQRHKFHSLVAAVAVPRQRAKRPARPLQPSG